MARRAFVPALAFALLACGGGHGGDYAVTILDAADIDCRGDRRSEAVSEAQLKAAVNGLEETFKTTFVLEPPRPEGHVMRVVETADEMRAWFDGPLPQQSGIPIALSPSEVFLGIPHEDSIEGDADDVFRFNVSPPSGTGVTGDCGELLRSASALRLTVDEDAVQGRVRRTDYLYQSVGLSPCDIRISCARSFLIDGAFVEH